MRHFPAQVVSYRRVEERSNALVRLFTCVQGDWWSGSGQRQFFLTVSLAHHSQATLPRHFPRDTFVGYRCCNRCFFSMLCLSSLDFGMSPLAGLHLSSLGFGRWHFEQGHPGSWPLLSGRKRKFQTPFLQLNATAVKRSPHLAESIWPPRRNIKPSNLGADASETLTNKRILAEKETKLCGHRGGGAI